MCGAIRATGLSYKDHAVRLPLPLRDAATSLMLVALAGRDEFPPPTRPHPLLQTLHNPRRPNEVVLVPKVAQNDEMDYEVELAIVIGRDAKDVDEASALNHVLGYTCGNDLTARKHQETSSQWGFCKGECDQQGEG